MIKECSTIDIYFHMKNHYKKLRSVKPVVDTSFTKQSFIESIREEHSRKAGHASGFKKLHYPHHNISIKKHDCLHGRSQSTPPSIGTAKMRSEVSSKQEGSARTRSSGPSTSRTENGSQKSSSRKLDTDKLPQKKTFKEFANKRAKSSRKSSGGGVPRKSSKDKYEDVLTQYSDCDTQGLAKHTLSLDGDQEDGEDDFECVRCECPVDVNQNGKGVSSVTYSLNVQDHEYLQFALRITEDIIRNDQYTSKEMIRVFNSHIEANRGRLDLEKMKKQIIDLSFELGIECDENVCSKMSSVENGLPCFREDCEREAMLKKEKKRSEWSCGLKDCTHSECFQFEGNGSSQLRCVYFEDYILRKAHTGETNGSDGIPGTERELDIRNVIFEGFLMETPANDASCVKDNGEIQEVDLSLPHGDEVAENVEVLKSDVSVTEDKSNNLTCRVPSSEKQKSLQSVEPNFSSNLSCTSKVNGTILDEMKAVDVRLLSVEAISASDAVPKSPERLSLSSVQNQIERVDKAVITDEVTLLHPPTADDTTQTDKIEKMQERKVQTDDLTVSRKKDSDIGQLSTGKCLRGDVFGHPQLYTIFPHVVTAGTGVEDEIEKLVLIPGPVYVPQKILEMTYKENAFRDKNLDVTKRINIKDYETPAYETRRSQNSATFSPPSWYTKSPDKNAKETSHGKTKTSASYNTSMNNLLLSSEYDFDTLPKLSDFFPSVSTQTNPSDISIINKLMNLQTRDMQIKTVTSKPRRTSIEDNYVKKEVIQAASPVGSSLEGIANNVEEKIPPAEHKSRNGKQLKVEAVVHEDYSKSILKDEESFLNAMDDVTDVVTGVPERGESYTEKLQRNSQKLYIEILDRKPAVGTSPSMEQTILKVQQQTEQFRRPDGRRISWGGWETPLANLDKYQSKGSENEFADADSDDVNIKRLSSRLSDNDDKK